MGRGAELHREESSRAGAGPGAKAGLTPSYRLQSEKASYAGYSLENSGKLSVPKYEHDKAGLWVTSSSLTALTQAFKFNQAPLPRPVPTNVVAPDAGPRDPLRGDQDLSLSLPKTPGQLGTGHHTGQIGALCLQDPQPQAPISHLHLHLPLLGLWQENPSQGMSYHLCRESLPWLLPKTQTSTMTDPPLQGEQAPNLDRDSEPFTFPILETPCPRAGLALQPLSLSAPHRCHQLAPNTGEIEFPSPKRLFIWFVWNFLMFYFFLAFCIFFR